MVMTYNDRNVKASIALRLAQPRVRSQTKKEHPPPSAFKTSFVWATKMNAANHLEFHGILASIGKSEKSLPVTGEKKGETCDIQRIEYYV